MCGMLTHMGETVHYRTDCCYYFDIACDCCSWLLQMVAKGKDASELFPAVVKNVVSKNLEVNGKTERL